MNGRILIAMVLAACSGSDRDESSQIYSNKADGYSVGQPDGWNTSDDRGSTRFSRSTGKQTIVVRSARRPTEITEGKPTTNEDVIVATSLVLQRMSRTKLVDPVRVENAELTGVRFTLTYQPPDVRTPYQRTHVVLFGEKRLYHVIQTAPQGEPVDDGALKEMVSTLTEEG